PGVAARERRRLALLAAALTVPPGPDAMFVSRRALELMADKARSFGGRVEELTRTGIVAVFGLETVEDAAVRAANAALAIVNGIERARRADGAHVAVRMAVHVDHFLVAAAPGGPVIDLEARFHAWTFLESLLTSAEPDGIVVSAPAAAFLERRFDLSPAALSEPGATYRLAGRERAGVVPQGRTAIFVGRQHELNLLRSRLDAAARGQGQIVGISGDAGIGKSRLLFELRRPLAGRAATCLEGRCVSYGATIPYAPVLDIVRAAGQMLDTDPPETAAAKVAAALRDAGMDPAAGAPHLLRLLGVKEGWEALAALGPEEAKARAFDTLRQLLLRSSRLRPLVLVVEDLHWIDRASEEFFTSFADLVVAAPVLMLCTYRSGYRPPWIDRSYATQMALQPLESGASVSVVRSVLGAAPVDDSVVEMILVRGEGNPFFLEELARTVDELGAAQTALMVPATVHDVVLARIDRLPPIEKHVLHVAAVIGKDAALPLVREVAGLPEETLRQSLARLRAAELLYETTLDAEPQYTFKHALTHEVAYGNVGDRRRREIHDGIVDAIERLHAGRLGDHIERLADHAFRAERWEKAVVHLRAAGLKAAERSAHREAVACFERALLALRRMPESQATLERAIDLRFDLRTSLTPLGEHRQVLDHMEDARRVAETLGDARRLGRVSAYMADYARLMGRYDEAIEAGRRALTIARDLGDFALQVASTMYVGQAHYNLGLYLAGADLFRRNLAVLTGDLARERFGLPYVAAVHTRTWMNWCLAELGDFDEAIALGREALQIAEAAGHPFSLTSAYAGMARPHLRRGHFALAVEILERGIALGRAWNIRLLLPALAADLGLAYAMTGRADEALPLLEQAAEYQASMRGTAGQSPRFTLVGEAHLRAGRRDEALRFAERALELARLHRERGNHAYGLRLLGEIAARTEPPEAERADGSYRSALALAEELEMRPLAGRCQLGLAELHRRAGNAALAHDAAAAAVTLFGAMGMTFWRERAEAEQRALG
ncbi:MAG: AAA family ATPase, partial [Candidatus Rokuibacteriota bacterium]